MFDGFVVCYFVLCFMVYWLLGLGGWFLVGLVIMFFDMVVLYDITIGWLICGLIVLFVALLGFSGCYGGLV